MLREVDTLNRSSRSLGASLKEGGVSSFSRLKSASPIDSAEIIGVRFVTRPVD